jgi:hypothetical protein
MIEMDVEQSVSPAGPVLDAGLVVDAAFLTYLPQRPAERAHQLDRVSGELLGILRWTRHQDILPQTSVWIRDFRSRGGSSDQYRPDRQTDRPNLGFGHGKRCCAGDPLARAKADVAAEAVSGNLPGLRIVEWNLRAGWWTL